MNYYIITINLLFIIVMKLFILLFILTSCSIFNQIDADYYHISLETYCAFKKEYYNKTNNFSKLSSFSSFINLRKKIDLQSAKKIYDEYSNYSKLSSFNDFLIVKESRTKSIDKIYKNWENCQQFPEDKKIKEFRLCGYLDFIHYVNLYNYNSGEKYKIIQEDNRDIILHMYNYDINEIILKYGANIILEIEIDRKKEKYRANIFDYFYDPKLDNMNYIANYYEKYIDKIKLEQNEQIETEIRKKREIKEKKELKILKEKERIKLEKNRKKIEKQKEYKRIKKEKMNNIINNLEIKYGRKFCKKEDYRFEETMLYAPYNCLHYVDGDRSETVLNQTSEGTLVTFKDGYKIGVFFIEKNNTDINLVDGETIPSGIFVRTGNFKYVNTLNTISTVVKMKRLSGSISFK